MTYTERRTSRVFEETTTEAAEGDYFRLPGQPIFRVIGCMDLGDYVSYWVQAGKEKPEHWDIMKPFSELEEQERNRLQAEEIEAYEVELSNIIHGASQEEVELALGLLQPLEQYDWLTERIGADVMTYIFGLPGEEQAEILPPVDTAYFDPYWTSHSCEF